MRASSPTAAPPAAAAVDRRANQRVGASRLSCPCEPEHGLPTGRLVLVSAVGRIRWHSVFGKGRCGHLVGGSRITQVFQAMHQLALHASPVVRGPADRREPGALLARPLPSPPAQPQDPRRSQPPYQHDLRQAVPLAGGEDAYLLSEPGEAGSARRIRDSNRITSPSSPGRPSAQDLNGALSLPGVHDASGPGQHHR